MKRGKFITLEGGEGGGKSTQARRLKAALEERGLAVTLTREPGGTPLGEELRRLLKTPGATAPRDRTELLLFLAARAQLVEELILPALERGEWVVADRFSDSTFAYQGYGRGLPLGELVRLNGFACQELKPDRTLLFDLAPEVAAERMRRREQATATTADRIELAGADFHARLRQGFLEMAAAEPQRFVVIDAGLGVDAVWEQVWNATLPLI